MPFIISPLFEIRAHFLYFKLLGQIVLTHSFLCLSSSHPVTDISKAAHARSIARAGCSWSSSMLLCGVGNGCSLSLRLLPRSAPLNCFTSQASLLERWLIFILCSILPVHPLRGWDSYGCFSNLASVSLSTCIRVGGFLSPAVPYRLCTNSTLSVQVYLVCLNFRNVWALSMELTQARDSPSPDNFLYTCFSA